MYFIAIQGFISIFKGELCRVSLEEYFPSNKDKSEENKLIERGDLSPHSSWPPVGGGDGKSAAIPVAWLLESIFEVDEDNNQDAVSQKIWKKIADRCEEHKDKKWAVSAKNAINKPSAHLDRIMKGLCYAKRLRVVALEVPSDEERALNNETDDKADGGISDVEHLFQRLNNAGTVLGGEELAYSMIKAYWPGIEKSFAALKIRPMAESQLAMLGTRAALINSEEYPNKLPPTLSVTALRKLARHKDKRAQFERVVKSFGLTGESETVEHFRSSDLHKNLNQIDSWLLFNGEPGDFGLPPVLRTSIAQKTPDIFLLLLYIAQQVTKPPVAESFVPALRKHIVAMASTLYLFADDHSKAADYIFKKIKNLLDNKEPLNEQTFRGILLGCRDLGKGNPGILNVLKPDDLEILIPQIDENNIDNWSFKNVSFENNLSFLKVLRKLCITPL